MKKTFFMHIFAAAVIISSGAFEIGGLYENYTAGSTIEENSVHKNKIALMVTNYFSDNAFFQAQGSAAFSKDEYDLLADLDYLYYRQDIYNLSGGNAGLTWQAGRFLQSEFTGKVFSHRLDGLSAAYSSSAGNAEYSIGAGYTGLLPKAASDINTSTADIIDENDDDIFFAPAKAVILSGAQFTDILPLHNLNFSAVLHFDLRQNDEIINDGDPYETNKKGGSFNSLYLGTGLSGAFSGSLFYDVFIYGQGASYISLEDNIYREKPVLAYLTGGSINYLKQQERHSLKISNSVIFASGDNNNTTVYESETSDKYIRQFIPLTDSSTGLIFSPSFSNVVIIGTSISVTQPLSYSDRYNNKNLETSINMYNIFRPTKGATSETAAAQSGSYGIGRIGTEIDLTVNARVFSDLGLSFGAGIFFPDMAGVFPDSYKEAEAGGMFKASLSF